MNALFLWMRVEPKGGAYWKFLFQVTFLCLFYVFCIVLLQSLVLGHIPDITPSATYLRGRPPSYYGELLVKIAWEEVRFRLPLIPLILFRVRPAILFSATLVLSVYFGYMHQGSGTVLVQGVQGLLFCVVFMKCGGLQRKFWKASASSFLVHNAYNFSLAAIIAALFL